MDITALYRQRCAEPSDICEHLEYLYDQVCRFPGAVVVELGTRTGVSTAALLAAVEQVGGELWSVDIVMPRLPDIITDHPAFNCLIGDDLALVDELPDCDVLFIDTSHHYGQTVAELAAYMPKCKGVALFHDTSLNIPDDAPAGDPEYPVGVAISEWCAANGKTWVNRDWNNGLGTIEVKQ